MGTKALLSPSKYDVNFNNIWFDGGKKILVTIQTPRWMGMKGLLPPSNHFGWSGKTFRDDPNSELDTETDADHKRFFTHSRSLSLSLF